MGIYNTLLLDCTFKIHQYKFCCAGKYNFFHNSKQFIDFYFDLKWAKKGKRVGNQARNLVSPREIRVRRGRRAETRRRRRLRRKFCSKTNWTLWNRNATKSGIRWNFFGRKTTSYSGRQTPHETRHTST